MSGDQTPSFCLGQPWNITRTPWAQTPGRSCLQEGKQRLALSAKDLQGMDRGIEQRPWPAFLHHEICSRLNSVPPKFMCPQNLRIRSYLGIGYLQMQLVKDFSLQFF